MSDNIDDLTVEDFVDCEAEEEEEDDDDDDSCICSVKPHDDVLVGTLYGHRQAPQAACFVPKEEGTCTLLTGGKGASVCMWRLPKEFYHSKVISHHRVRRKRSRERGESDVSLIGDDLIHRFGKKKKKSARSSGKIPSISSLAISPCQQFCASGNEEGNIVIYDLKAFQKKCTLSGHENKVSSISFSSDQNLMASASFDWTFRLWNVANMHGCSDIECIQVVKGHHASLCCVAFSPSGKLLASAGYDNTIKLWSFSSERRQFDFTTTRRPEKPIKDQEGESATYLLYPRKNKLGVSERDARPREQTKMIGTFNRNAKIATGDGLMELEHRYQGHTRSVTCLLWGKTSKFVASGSADGTVCFWNTSERHLTTTRPHGPGGALTLAKLSQVYVSRTSEVRSITLLRNDALLLTASEATLKLWRCDERDTTWILAHRFASGHEELYSFAALEYDNDNIFVASLVSAQCAVEMWNVAKYAEISAADAAIATTTTTTTTTTAIQTTTTSTVLNAASSRTFGASEGREGMVRGSASSTSVTAWSASNAKKKKKKMPRSAKVAPTTTTTKTWKATLNDKWFWVDTKNKESRCGPYEAREINIWRTQGFLNDHFILRHNGKNGTWKRFSSIDQSEYLPPKSTLSPLEAQLHRRRRWFFYDLRRCQGPKTTYEMRTLAQSGKIHESCWIKRMGKSSEWVVLRELPNVTGFFHGNKWNDHIEKKKSKRVRQKWLKRILRILCVLVFLAIAITAVLFYGTGVGD